MTPRARTVGMITVLKNLSNLMTIGGDYYFYNQTYSWQVGIKRHGGLTMRADACRLLC